MEPSSAPTPPIVMLFETRTRLVLMHLLTALVIVPLMAAAAATISFVASALGTAALLASFAWSLSRRWNDRLEVSPERLVAWRGGRSRVIPVEEIANLSVQFFNPRQGFDAQQSLLVTITPRAGEAIALTGGVRHFEAGLNALSASMSRAMIRRMEAGETLTFDDRSRFPYVLVLGGGLVTAAAVAALVLAALSHHHTGFAGAVRGTLFLLVIGWSSVQALRRWFSARRSLGLAVSTQGFRPLVEHQSLRETVDQSHYRSPRGAASAWIPWGDLAAVQLDSFGITLRAVSRPDPIVLTSSGQNLFVLDRLANELWQRARADAARSLPTMVRIADAAPEVAPEAAAAAIPQPGEHSGERH